MTFRRVSNVVAVVVFACVLCCVVGTKALSHAGVPFPDFMEVGAKSSALEGKAFKSFPKPTVESVSGGAFQSDADQWLSDHMPCRERVLMAYALLQRTSIRVANLPFGFDVYPTFLESEIALCESTGALYEIPMKATDAMAAKLKERAGDLAQLAAEQPGASFYLYAVPHAITLDASPAAGLMSRPFDASFFTANYASRLDPVTVVDSGVSLGGFSKGWYKTDHHWNVDGAYEGYARIASALGFGDSLVQRGELTMYDQPVFYGSYARRGRISELSDRVFDYDFDLGELTVAINGEGRSAEDLAHRRLYASGGWSGSTFANRYAEYFHSDYREIVIAGADSDTDRTLLLVADSYSNCVERLFAKHYAKVLVFDYRADGAPSLPDYLADHPEVDDVVVLVHPVDLIHTRLDF